MGWHHIYYFVCFLTQIYIVYIFPCQHSGVCDVFSLNLLHSLSFPHVLAPSHLTFLAFILVTTTIILLSLLCLLVELPFPLSKTPTLDYSNSLPYSLFLKNHQHLLHPTPTIFTMQRAPWGLLYLPWCPWCIVWWLVYCGAQQIFAKWTKALIVQLITAR